MNATGRRIVTTSPVLSPTKSPNGKLNSNSVTDSDTPVTALTKQMQRLQIQERNYTTPVCLQKREQEEQAATDRGNTSNTIAEHRIEHETNGKESVNDSLIFMRHKNNAGRSVVNAINGDNVVISSESVGGTENGDDTSVVIDDNHTNNDIEGDDNVYESVTDNSEDSNDGKSINRVSKTALDNIARAGSTQQFKFSTLAGMTHPITTTATSTSLATSAILPPKQIGVIRPILSPAVASAASSDGANNNMSSESLNNSNSVGNNNNNNYNNNISASGVINSEVMETVSGLKQSMHGLTTREIEKNRINELKKTAIEPSGNNASLPVETKPMSAGVLTTTASGSSSSNSNSNNSVSLTGYTDVDSVISASNNPLWAMRKRRQTPASSATAVSLNDNTMVFNFSNRKEVPDYIENDGVIIRRKRELPKVSESISNCGKYCGNIARSLSLSLVVRFKLSV